MQTWNFITNHARVLIHVGVNPDSTLRETAQAVGMTDRAVYSILRTLEADGLVSRQKVSRNNHYSVDLQAVFRHETQTGRTLGELVVWLSELYLQLNGSS